MKPFDFEEERLKQEIVKYEAKRVLIQLPDGLKVEGPRLARIVEKAGALPIISADPCYGGCDLATAEAESLGVDLLVHYGHAKLLKYEKVPTIYIEARATLDISEAVEKALPLIEPWRKVGLATTVQHVQVLDEAKEMLVRAGKTVIVGDAGRLSYPGQVIGCDYSNAKSIIDDVEGFLFIGGGRFHALGLALSTLKPTVVADPFEKIAYTVNEEAERIQRQRWASIQEAQKARTFGVLVGLKPGQKRLEEALVFGEKLKKGGKDAFLFAVREITPEMVMNFPTVDAYVNVACPRISLDEPSKFNKPILTPNEALVVLGELSWKELCRRGFL
ncbi:MAG: diphthamide biosynthesis enzyme Dph2 [Candidatus Bathyarchaeota archaeon]|nr:diphthamide biosynthesis enzyme Dph2 [Candidatus Bathyarchaeota archaeon]MDW8039928.1 diphthamide biosynthesis enzyme Dph2 [Nitrososphaerota archaeon]